MSNIIAIYSGAEPVHKATDNDPSAVRYPFVIAGVNVFVDALNGAPTADEVAAILNPVPAASTPAQKLAAAGLTVGDLQSLLGMAVTGPT